MEDRQKIFDFSDKLMNILQEYADENDIDINCRLVGSMAKKTSLMDKSDIDIFISFPLSYSEEELKEYGLQLGNYCIDKVNGDRELRYASHPYVTGLIDEYEVDFVPCYAIRDSSQLKSAVDRTILHTDYVQGHLTDEEADQVLLLKKFMTSVNTYGANFKVSGFSGYLCELLILEYHSFENVINAAANTWKNGFRIDLENYGTCSKFNAPMIVIDPVDKNRNVAAALSLQKLSEFIIACRNFLRNPCREYFEKREINVSREELLSEFESRDSSCYVLSFNVPELPDDVIYPQISKTMKSLAKTSESNGFSLIDSNFYIDSCNVAHIILEYEVNRLSGVKLHNGPSIRYEKNGIDFKKKYHDAYIKNDKWVAVAERKYKSVSEFIENIVKVENRNVLKLGKNVRDEITYNHVLESVASVIKKEKDEDYSNLFMHLHPDYMLRR